MACWPKLMRTPRGARTLACRVHTRVNASIPSASLCSQECEHGTHECVRYETLAALTVHRLNRALQPIAVDHYADGQLTRPLGDRNNIHIFLRNSAEDSTG